MAALYSKEQLAYERSKGLVLSDYDNEHFYDDDREETLYNWTQEQFESWLSTKNWSDSNKDNHRKEFKGKIVFYEGGGFSYA